MKRLFCCGARVQCWPKSPVRGDAAMWPLLVEHRTVGGMGPAPPRLTQCGHPQLNVAAVQTDV
jgi:hypothetical protein